MAFDFNNEVSIQQDNLFDVNSLYTPVIDEINKRYLYIRNSRRYDRIGFASLKQTKHKQQYIDCYKSNWDHYKSISYYNAFWETVLDPKFYSKTCHFKWKLNPYLGQIGLANNSIFWKYIDAKSTRSRKVFLLNIELIKQAMEIMYGHSILYRSNYVHTIHIEQTLSRCSALNSDYPVLFCNPAEELQEFKEWVISRINSGDWYLKNKKDLSDFMSNYHNPKMNIINFWATLDQSIKYLNNGI